MGLRVKEPIILFSGVSPEFSDLKYNCDPKTVRLWKILRLKIFFLSYIYRVITKNQSVTVDTLKSSNPEIQWSQGTQVLFQKETKSQYLNCPLINSGNFCVQYVIILIAI